MKNLLLFDFLPGKKTYLVGLGLIIKGISPLSEFLITGDPSQATVDMQSILEGLGLITLRKGVKKVEL